MYKFAILCLIAFFFACTSKNTINQPKYLNKEVSFKIVDSIICEGDTGKVFSNYLYPVRDDSINFIAFDLLTNNLLFYYKNNPQHCRIVDLQLEFRKYSILNDRFFGVVGVNNNNFLVCSEPYFLVIDSSMNIKNTIKVDFQENSTKYYRTGDASNIRLNSNKTCVYITVSPNMPFKNKNAFNKGRIMEINIENGNSKILPIKLPSDYKIRKDYRLFSVPNFTVFKNCLFCIFPGSNYLYKYDLQTSKLDSLLIYPKYVKINVKEVGSKMEDLFYSYLECNNFYQVVNDDKLILLFYWEGKKRKTYNKQNGLKEINCYIIGYDPEKNAVLFDSPFTPGNVLKKTYLFKEGVLYLPYQGEKETNKIESKILKYEMVIEE